ncbi:MAG: thiamine phosphate synthase [bacterium]
MSNEFGVMRIVDANINRAVEGLRVMEEVARFVLDDKAKTKQFKELRSRLRKVSIELKVIKHRDSAKDVGGKFNTKNENKRESLLDIFAANAKRVQEALRVLEEFLKLINTKYGKLLKDIRFAVYELEQQVSLKLLKQVKLDFDVYLVTDPMADHVKTIKKALAVGIKMVQIRDKGASKKQLLTWSKIIAPLSRKHGATFIVNDFFDIAKEVGADGVHLGQEDLKQTTLNILRKKYGDDLIIGVSTHSLDQAKKAIKAGADYISCGPIFKTPSKPLGRPLGLKTLRAVIKLSHIPVVAIGGINHSNIESVRKTGCQRVAMIRGLIKKLGG